MRLRLVNQRTAIWAKDWDVPEWIRNGRLRDQTQESEPEDPAVLVGREQIRKDGGRLIVENVNRAIEEWRVKTLKPDGPM